MRNRFFIYFFLLLVSVAGTTVLLVYKEFYYAIPVFALVVFAVIELIREYHANTRKITYMLNALENNDSSFRFTEKGGDRYNKLFIECLNKINGIIAAEKLSASEKEKYYGLILENVTTGVISFDDRGYVAHCNNRALNLLGLSVLTHISQLKRVDESVYDAFAAEGEGDDNGVVISLYNEKGEVHLSLHKSYFVQRGKQLKLFVINDIGEELESNEIEAWTRLIRVLTHEIMNTVTPISSLSDTLSMMVKNSNETGGKNENLLPELKQGLDAISFSSKGLISFVDSYRNLTRIPTPDCKPIYVKNLIKKVITLVRDDLELRSVDPNVEIGNDDVMIYADENLISQVMINLIKNAISAIDERVNVELNYVPYIRIKTSIDSQSEDVIIEIANNGLPISKENQEHIFIPFFTTKSNGSGIGLAISRQIMRKHNGSLKLKVSNEHETSFVLIFK